MQTTENASTENLSGKRETRIFHDYVQTS